MSRRARVLFVGAAIVGGLVPVRAGSADAIPAAAPSTGSLRGTVVLGARIAARRMSFRLYAAADGMNARPPEDATRPEVENVVVYLESAPAGAAPTRPPIGPFRIEQEGLTFKPHVLAVVKGTSVEFPNRDTLFHNVFSLSKAASFDLGRYPKDGTKAVRFDTPGVVPVFCHIHSDMSATVVVLDNPFFVSPDASGRFEIDGIPPGEYRVVAWHERARRTSGTVRIEAGKAAVLDFEIPLTEAGHGG